jgi:hypothetical protein
MSSTTTHTKTPDGRFQLTHRIKDSFGDFSCNEHHWRLIDTRSQKIIARWSDEDGETIADISFSEDHRAVEIHFRDSHLKLFALPK